MAIYDQHIRFLGTFFGDKTGPRRLHTKLLIALVPSLVALVVFTGYTTHKIANHFLVTALERNVRVQNMAMAHALENYLAKCRSDILFLSQAGPDAEEARRFLTRNAAAGGLPYRECTYISQTDQKHFTFVSKNGDIIQLTPAETLDVRPSRFLLYDSLKDMQPGTVRISSFEAVEYPFPDPQNANNRVSTHVFALATPWRSPQGDASGYFVLAIDAVQLRNLLSLYNSSKSPIWAYARSPELRFAFLFTTDGWIVFQSEDVDKPNLPLSSYLTRSSSSGTLGRPGLDCAFRPASDNSGFWKMVAETRERRSGSLNKMNSPMSFDMVEQFMAYAPITFDGGNGTNVFAGVAFVDRSRLTVVAGYKQVDVMFMVTLASTILACVGLYFFSRRVTRPLARLAQAVEKVHSSGKTELATEPADVYELRVLQDAVNSMLSTMRHQDDTIRLKDQQIESVSLKERVGLDDVEEYLNGESAALLPGLIGVGPKFDRLREEIMKTAQVDVDVLIVGETGTGKQLTAEHIHAYSKRSGKPLICINCGALDENLLLDTLFGHVKGAFTEAKTDRKGAFLEAQGGTLFLDEIQVASPKVQQALLRVLATRMVKQLGSDKEMDVDVRVIAATNIDLKEMIERREFREDLYFRLNVMSICTPPLREHKENILILTMYYLKEAGVLIGHDDLAMSRGALEILRTYNWPGNIRELKNCVIRSAITASGSIIQAHEVALEHDAASLAKDVPPNACPFPPSESAAPPARPRDPMARPARPEPEQPQRQPVQAPPAKPSAVPTDLNPRQQAACEYLRRHGAITRKEYEEMHSDVSARTAVYDLQDMVKKGVLKKTGRGPATRYVPMGKL
ncbi:MAG: sigma 54-interacting transcriptional regulator [Desulfovibrionaceae bacterium]